MIGMLMRGDNHMEVASRCLPHVVKDLGQSFGTVVLAGVNAAVDEYIPSIVTGFRRRTEGQQEAVSQALAIHPHGNAIRRCNQPAVFLFAGHGQYPVASGLCRWARAKGSAFAGRWPSRL